MRLPAATTTVREMMLDSRTRHPLLHAALTALLAVSLEWPMSAAAHGGLQPLATWGAFPPAAAYCQRIIGAAAAACALNAADLRRKCLDAQSRGAQCDETATTAAIASTRRDALDLVDLHCSERDAQAIGYLGGFDLQADIIRFCREWEVTTASAAYGPVLPLTAPLAPGDYACVAATAAAAAKLAQLTFSAWQGTLNRIAVRVWDLGAKTAMIDHRSARVVTLEPDAVLALSRRCDSSTFAAIYHRGPTELVQDVAGRAGCFPSAFYLQDKLVCPEPVCGNWIIEPGELCDDGNTAAGDGCDSECLAVSSP